MDHQSVMKLHLVNLKFTGSCSDLEAVFQKENAWASLRNNRAALLVGILLYSAFAVLDALAMPEMKSTLWLIRFAIADPVFLGILLLTFTKSFERHMNPLLALASVVAGGSIIAMIVLAPPPVNYSYCAGLLVVFSWTYAFARISFLWASLAGWILVILYEVASIWISPAPFKVLLSYTFFFVSANIMGMIACYSLEYYIRRGFFLSRQVELERENINRINRELERQTADYQAANRALESQMVERKKVEEALRESQELYARLVDTVTDAFVHTDLEGKILFVNDYTVQRSGYRREELVGHNILRFIAPEDRDAAIKNIDLMMSGPLGPREYRMITKDGRKTAFDVNGDVLRNTDGTAFGRVYVCRDIGDRKRAEEEQLLLEKMKSILEMAGAICHEMNQPMQIIFGESQLLSMHVSDQDPIRADVETIRKQVERMAAITKRLMSIKYYQTRDYVGGRIVDIYKSSGDEGDN